MGPLLGALHADAVELLEVDTNEQFITDLAVLVDLHRIAEGISVISLYHSSSSTILRRLKSSTL